MEEGKTNIFSLVIDPGKSEATIAQLTADLKAAKLAQQELEKSFKEGKIGLQDYGKESAASTRQVKMLTAELGAETKLLAMHTKQTKEAEGSNNQLRAQLSMLTQKFNALGKAERDNTKEGKDLQKQIRSITDELKANESAVGDNRRNVGNYTQGILQAVDGTGILATVTNTATQAQQKFTLMMNASKASIAGNITGMKALNLIMKANVFGIVVTVLAGLVSYLTRTQEGLDWLSAKTKGFTTVLGVLTDKLSSFGELIFKSFDNPKQAVMDLANFIGTNLMNRLKAFAVIWEGIQNRDLKQINNGLLQLSTGFEDVIGKTAALAEEMATANSAGQAIERTNQALLRSERQLNLERAESRKKIKELNLIAEDTTKSTAARAAAARQALEIEQGLMTRQIDLQKQRIKNIAEENKLTNSLNADDDRLAQAKVALEDLQQQSLEMQTTLNNKLNTLRKEGIALQEKATLQELENRKAQIEAELLATKEGTRERLDLQEAMIRQELLIQNKGAAQSLDQRKLNELKANAEILKLRSEFYKEATLEELKHRGALADQEQQSIVQVRDTLHKSNEATFEAMEEVRLRNEGYEKAKVEAAKYSQERLHEIELQRLDTAIVVTQGLSDLVEVVAGQSEETANFQKALAIFEMGLASAQAVMEGIKQSQKTGPFPLNLLALASTVGTVLSFAARAKSMLSEGAAPKAPKFDRGGYTGDGFGAPDESGYKIAGIVHENEYVAPEVVVNDPLAQPHLAALEGLRRLRLKKYDTGGYVTPMVGGINLQAPIRPVDPSNHLRPLTGTPQMPLAIDYNKLAAAMSRLPAPVVRTADTLAGIAQHNRVQVRTSQK